MEDRKTANTKINGSTFYEIGSATRIKANIDE